MLRSPHTDYDGDACGVNSSGNIGYGWDVASSYGRLSGRWWLRSPYVYYRDDYHVYFVRSDGDVDNNNVVWDDSYGKNRSPAFGTDSGTLLPDTSGEIGGWGDFNNAIKYSYG